MTSKVWVELSDYNGVVTDNYMKAIGRAFQRLGCNVYYEYDITNCRGGKQDIYVVSLALTAFKLLISGRPNVVFWSQGVWPEESLQKHGSRVRFAACNFIENMALKKRGFSSSSPMLNWTTTRVNIVFVSQTRLS